METNKGLRTRPVQEVTLTSAEIRWRVKEINPLLSVPVYCVVVHGDAPHEFTLPNGVLTGNCWVCSPNHGVDVIEYVILEQGLEHDAPSHLPPQKRHAIATIRAVEYLEEVFDKAYLAQPWEARLNKALHPRHAHADPLVFWNSQHQQLLITMLSVDDPAKWDYYARLIRPLGHLRGAPSHVQMPSWKAARRAITDLSHKET